MKLRHWLAIHVIGPTSGLLVGALLARCERFGWFLDQAPVLCAASGLLLSAVVALAIAVLKREVLQILGEPVYKSDPSEWRYSWGGRCLGESGGKSDCSCAWVYFAVEFSGDTVARPIVAWDRS